MTHLLAPNAVAAILDVHIDVVAETCALLEVRRYNIEGHTRYQAADVIRACMGGQ